MEMRNSHTAFDLKSQAVVTIPVPDMMVAGFPCIDVSPLNDKGLYFDPISPEDQANCGQTSFVMRGILDLVEQWDPVCVLLENVKALLRRQTAAGERGEDLLSPGNATNYSIFFGCAHVKPFCSLHIEILKNKFIGMYRGNLNILLNIYNVHTLSFM